MTVELLTRPPPQRAWVEQVRPREAEDEQGRVRELDERLDEIEECGCGPVHVVDHEEQGVFAREAGEQPPRCERDVLGVGRSGGEAGGGIELVGERAPTSSGRAASRSSAAGSPSASACQDFAERRVGRFCRRRGSARRRRSPVRGADLRTRCRAASCRRPVRRTPSRGVVAPRLRRARTRRRRHRAPPPGRRAASPGGGRTPPHRDRRPRINHAPSRSLGSDGVPYRPPGAAAETISPGSASSCSRVASSTGAPATSGSPVTTVAGRECRAAQSAQVTREVNGCRDRAERVVVLRDGDAEHRQQARRAERDDARPVAAQRAGRVLQRAVREARDAPLHRRGRRSA